MLLKTQRIEADQLVKEGKPFPAELAAAVLAAVDEANAAHHAVQFQYSEANSLVQKCESERDGIRRARLELEARIDTRVQLRTADLREALAIAKNAKETAEYREASYEIQLQESRENASAYQSQQSAVIFELRQLIEQQMKPSFLKRLRWQRAARRVLKEADRL